MLTKQSNTEGCKQSYTEGSRECNMDIKKMCRIITAVGVLMVMAALAATIAAAALAVPVSAASKPGKVSSLKVTKAADTSVALSWGKSSGATKYEVQYKVSTAKSWKSSKTSSRKITIKGLKQSTKYNFKVRGLKGSKKGAFSKTVTQRTFGTPAAVPAPSIFASERKNNEITLRWAASKNATNYQIKMWKLNKKDPIDEQGANYVEESPGKYIHIPEYTTRVFLRPNTWYRFEICAVNGNTGKFPAIVSKEAHFSACTTSGNRVITGVEQNSNGETIHAFNMNDTFAVGVDDALVPTGVYEHTDIIEGMPGDTYYETDYMTVQGVSFPADFEPKEQSGTSVDLKGKTFKTGDMLDGKTIQGISIYPDTGDNGETGEFVVAFKMSDAFSITVNW